MIFLDAGPLIAFFNGRDRYHLQAKHVFEELFSLKRTFITTNRVIAEVYDAIRYDRRLSHKKDAKRALAIFDALEASKEFIDVLFTDRNLEQKAIDILRAYSDQDFSFTDATSFAMIEEKGIKQVLTLDVAHFSTYRPAKGKKFSFYPLTLT